MAAATGPPALSKGTTAAAASSSTAPEAVVLAACPREHHAALTQICKQQKIMRAFSTIGSTLGKGWVAQWESHVLMAVVGLVEERGAHQARIVCVDGGENCVEQMAAQHHLVQAVQAALGNASFPVQCVWMSFEAFCAEFDGRALAGDTDAGPVPTSIGGSGASAKKGAGRGSKGFDPRRRSGGPGGSSLRSPRLDRFDVPARRATQRCNSAGGGNEQLVVAWVCCECKAYFETHEKLVDHQQHAGHWNPTLDHCGRTFVTASEFRDHKAVSGPALGADGDGAAEERADVAGADAALGESCQVFDMSGSPRSDDGATQGDVAHEAAPGSPAPGPDGKARQAGAAHFEGMGSGNTAGFMAAPLLTPPKVSAQLLQQGPGRRSHAAEGSKAGGGASPQRWGRSPRPQRHSEGGALGHEARQGEALRRGRGARPAPELRPRCTSPGAGAAAEGLWPRGAGPQPRGKCQSPGAALAPAAALGRAPLRQQQLAPPSRGPPGSEAAPAPAQRSIGQRTL